MLYEVITITPGQLETRFVRPGLRDTLSPRFGLEWQPGPLDRKLALRAGYSWSPSPVPEQAGLVTYADSAAHILAAGAGFV